VKQQWKLWPWVPLGFIVKDHVREPDQSQEPDVAPETFARAQRDNLNLILQYTLAWALLFASYMWCFASLLWEVRAGSPDEVKNWFGSAGALLAASALILEWRLKRLKNNSPAIMGVYCRLYPMTVNSSDAPPIENPNNLEYWTELLAFGSILLGTFVWAYGDKIVLCLAYGEFHCT